MREENKCEECGEGISGGEPVYYDGGVVLCGSCYLGVLLSYGDG